VVELIPVTGLPEIVEGDDLAALIAEAVELADSDVVVIAQKVVSKAEGALVALAPGEDVATARRRLAAEEARRVVVDAPWVLIVETRHGLVCANAGLDASNVAEGYLARLPDDPDASAARLRAGLAERAGVDVGVVVTDTFGRPWRTGQTEVAIGSSGIAVLRDEASDRSGRALTVTEPAVADALAASADLVRRKDDGVPVVIVRGAQVDRDDDATAADLRRPAALDLFPRGRGMLAAALASEPAAPAGPPPPGALEVPLRAAARAGGDAVAITQVGDGGPVTVRLSGAGRDGAVRAGAAAAALVAACLDVGMAAAWRPAGPDEAGHAVVVAGAEPAPRLPR
jgi:coenzyme F420-0:L-glutamate ligase/coenzyme F420-1:gamma-L-glutamate ligase